jgi:hypothetical protein
MLLMPTGLQLNIADPCHENWNDMTPQQQGRFCGSCQKVVVDFSVMTDKEILNYFSTATQRVCGRFANDQLNKELKPAEHKRRFSWAYVWNVLLATFLITETNAQVKPKKPVTSKVSKVHKPATPVMEVPPLIMGAVEEVPADQLAIPSEIYGTVIDAETNLLVPRASILIPETGYGTPATKDGQFYLHLDKKQSTVVEITAIGYEKQVITINENTPLPVQVLLKPEAKELEAVSVVAYGSRMGLVRIVRTVTVTDKLMASLPAPLKKDIKVYPNPVARGNNINVSLQLKQAGDYKLELLNTAGQVVHIQPLKMATNQQVITLPTQTAWAAGVYWIRISSSAIKNVYQGKILVQ